MKPCHGTGHATTTTCSQSYKDLMIVNYNSGVVIELGYIRISVSAEFYQIDHSLPTVCEPGPARYWQGSLALTGGQTFVGCKRCDQTSDQKVA